MGHEPCRLVALRSYCIEEKLGLNPPFELPPKKDVRTKDMQCLPFSWLVFDMIVKSDHLL